MFSWSAFITLVGFVGSVISIYQVIRNRQSQPHRVALLCFIVFAVLFVTSIVFSNVLSPSGNSALVSTPVATSNTTQLGTEETPPPSPTSIQTPIPKSYQANWSQGMDGWLSSDQDWSAVNGMLVNDGNQYNYDGNPSILAPFPSGNITNYSVQAGIRLDRYTDQGSYNHASFGVAVRYSDNDGGFKLGHCAEAAGFSLVSYCDSNGSGTFHEIILSDGNFYNDIPVQKAPFEPAYGKWHTYRIDVNGNVITVWLDGSQIFQVTDDRHPSGGKVGLWSDRCQISIRSFTITAL